MSLRRQLLANSRVAARLERSGQGFDLPSFIERISGSQLINDVFNLDGHSAVVGHSVGFDSLRQHIRTFMRRSYQLGDERTISPRSIDRPRTAYAASRHRERFAKLTIAVEPNDEQGGIALTFGNPPDVNPEVTQLEYPNAIMDGLCRASLSSFHEPVVNVRVKIVSAKWHPFDSDPSTFEEVAFEAMSEILSTSTFV